MRNKMLALALLGVSGAAAGAAVGSQVLPATAFSLAQVSLLPPVQTQPAVEPVRQAPPAPAYFPSGGINEAIARWNSLRQSDSNSFSAYSSFLTRYRGWPGESGLRRSAERALGTAAASPYEVVSYFAIHPPLTPGGHAKHAFALQSVGRVNEAREAARRAWTAGVLPRPDEDRLLTTFPGLMTAADHDRRMDVLLANGDTTSAQRTLPLSSFGRRQLYEARIALQSRAPDAASRVDALAASNDAGLLQDRVTHLWKTGNVTAARALLARPRTLTSRPADPEAWFEALLQQARGAAADRQWSMVYQIASQIDDAYPVGTDVSAQPYGERDDYTSLAWLAGTTALHQLGRSADAIGMFERYARGARSPQTQTKGFYWAGRAALQAGQAERANGFFAQASAHPDQFYGQLALERLNRPVPAPAAAAPVPITPEARAAFNQRDLVQATRILGQTGRWADQSLFLRTLTENLKTPEERQLASELGRQIGRLDMGVWVARNARTGGDTFYTRAGFPDVSIPPTYIGQWTLNHAIMRQESSFDRAAVSHAGARGMMQLMPGTARETAGKLGLGYDFGRLTSDPQYNIMLGSKYFSDLMVRYGNYAPLAVAAYNAGPGNANRFVRENGDPRQPHIDVVRWIEEIPISETRNYVQRVLENAVVYDTLNPALARTPPRNRLSYYLGKSARPG